MFIMAGSLRMNMVTQVAFRHTITAMEVLVVYLNRETKKILENSIGKSIHELSQMDADEERAFVISKIGRVPIFSKKPDSRMRGRGNPLIARRRICTMDDIDKRIMELK